MLAYVRVGYWRHYWSSLYAATFTSCSSYSSGKRGTTRSGKTQNVLINLWWVSSSLSWPLSFNHQKTCIQNKSPGSGEQLCAYWNKNINWPKRFIYSISMHVYIGITIYFIIFCFFCLSDDSIVSSRFYLASSGASKPQHAVRRKASARKQCAPQKLSIANTNPYLQWNIYLFKLPWQLSQFQRTLLFGSLDLLVCARLCLRLVNLNGLLPSNKVKNKCSATLLFKYPACCSKKNIIKYWWTHVNPLINFPVMSCQALGSISSVGCCDASCLVWFRSWLNHSPITQGKPLEDSLHLQNVHVRK